MAIIWPSHPIFRVCTVTVRRSVVALVRRDCRVVYSRLISLTSDALGMPIQAPWA